MTWGERVGALSWILLTMGAYYYGGEHAAILALAAGTFLGLFGLLEELRREIRGIRSAVDPRGPKGGTEP